MDDRAFESPFHEVDGLKDLAKALRKLEDKDFIKELKAANKRASEAAVAAAKAEAPVRSGRLRDSIKPNVTQTSGGLKAGTAARVPYAGPIHFGWPRRFIPANPFIYRGLDKAMPEIIKAYEEDVVKLFEAGGIDNG